MTRFKLLCTLMFPLVTLACDSPDDGLADDAAGHEIDDADDAAAVHPDAPDEIGTAAADPEQHLLCVLCVLHGHDEVCGDDGHLYTNACFAACHGADVVPEGTYYTDADGDGFGDGEAPGVVVCAQPPGSAANDDDCDDGESASFPGNPEVCDELDNDCDGAVDEDAPGILTYYTDNDGDGFGDGGAAGVVACGQPAGTAPNGEDCDDDEGTAFPGNPELCDGLDNDCNGAIDEGAANGDGEFYQLVGAPTVLPTVGKPNAAPYVRDCPCGSVAVGISGKASDISGYANLAQFSLICERLDGDGSQGLRFDTAPVGTFNGGDPGDVFSGECPLGEVLVNYTIGVAFNINNPNGSGGAASIETDCAAVVDVLAAQTTTDAVLGPYTNTTATIQASSPVQYTCPPGQVVRGMHGGSGVAVDELGFSCQQLVLQ